MLDLADLIDPDSGWTLSTAKAINDDGWIIGIGDNPAGETAGFLLTPIIPEPSTAAAAACLGALAGLALRRVQRARTSSARPG